MIGLEQSRECRKPLRLERTPPPPFLWINLSSSSVLLFFDTHKLELDHINTDWGELGCLNACSSFPSFPLATLLADMAYRRMHLKTKRAEGNGYPTSVEKVQVSHRPSVPQWCWGHLSSCVWLGHFLPMTSSSRGVVSFVVFFFNPLCAGYPLFLFVSFGPAHCWSHFSLLLLPAHWFTN